MLIQHARLVDAGGEREGDILIRDGRIAAVGEGLAAGADAPRRHGPRLIRPERDHRISGILISPIGSKTDASLQTSPQAGAAIP